MIVGKDLGAIGRRNGDFNRFSHPFIRVCVRTCGLTADRWRLGQVGGGLIIVTEDIGNNSNAAVRNFADFRLTLEAFLRRMVDDVLVVIVFILVDEGLVISRRSRLDTSMDAAIGTRERFDDRFEGI